MPAEVVWSPVAVSDLDAIWEWIAVENGEPAVAERTITAILDRVDVDRGLSGKSDYLRKLFDLEDGTTFYA